MSVDEGEEGEVGDEVADYDGNEGKTLSRCSEVPLLVDRLEGFEEGEDEGVGEPREKRETEHDWFANEHLERADPDDQDFFDSESVLFELVRSIYVGLSCLAPLLGQSVQDDCRSCFWHEQKVRQLHGSTEDELDPEVPGPTQVTLNECSYQRTEC